MSQTNTSPAGGRTHSRKRVIHLVNELRRVADDTANPERADLMMRAAAEIEQLIEELKERLESARLNHAEEK
jgi:6-phosphogluconate dehydrogenase